MKFHHLIWIEVVGHVNAFQNHSFLKIKTMRTGMANSTPLEREVPKLSLWQVPKLQQSWQAFNNVKCQAIVQDILLLEKYLNMIMNLDTFSLSPSPSRDIHPQIIPGTCMMKLPCVVTVQWARRPPMLLQRFISEILTAVEQLLQQLSYCKRMIYDLHAGKNLHQMMVRGGNLEDANYHHAPSSYEADQNLGNAGYPLPCISHVLYNWFTDKVASPNWLLGVAPPTFNPEIWSMHIFSTWNTE